MGLDWFIPEQYNEDSVNLFDKGLCSNCLKRRSDQSFVVKTIPDIQISEYLVQKAQLGSTGKIECLATSVPMVQSVLWFDNKGEQIKNSTKHHEGNSVYLNQVKSILTITNVMPEDLTAYTCQVKNSLGTAKATFNLESGIYNSIILVPCVLCNGQTVSAGQKIFSIANYVLEEM